MSKGNKGGREGRSGGRSVEGRKYSVAENIIASLSRSLYAAFADAAAATQPQSAPLAGARER